MRDTERFMALGGWAAGIVGTLGACALAAAECWSPPYVFSTTILYSQALRVFPWRPAMRYALPSLFVALGATLDVRYPLSHATAAVR